MSSSACRLVICDDHTVVLDGLRALFELEPDLEVVATCTDGLELVATVEADRPDLIVLDSSMPRCDGLEAVQRMVEAGILPPTILLSATLTDDEIVQALGLGVRGVVLKESAAAVLIDAVRAVARGGRWISPEVAVRVAEATERRALEEEEGLTDREREVVGLVAEGLSNKRVASRLGIAESTVKLHLHHAFSKLGVRNRVQLTLLAQERGWA